MQTPSAVYAVARIEENKKENKKKKKKNRNPTIPVAYFRQRNSPFIFSGRCAFFASSRNNQAVHTARYCGFSRDAAKTFLIQLLLKLLDALCTQAYS